jgi:hypothetical protein
MQLVTTKTVKNKKINNQKKKKKLLICITVKWLSETKKNSWLCYSHPLLTGISSIPTLRILAMGQGEWVTPPVSKKQDQEPGMTLHSPTTQMGRKEKGEIKKKEKSKNKGGSIGEGW